MKKHYLLILSIFTVFAITSCSSDDEQEDNNTQSSITLNENKPQELKKVVLNHYFYGEEENGNYTFDLTLYTTQGNITNEGTYGIFSPNDQIYSELNVHIRSSLIDKLDTGVFEYTNSEETDHFEGGEFSYNYDINAEQEEEYYLIKGGEIEVIRNQNPYEFKFEFVLDNNDVVKGYYKGNVDYIEYN